MKFFDRIIKVTELLKTHGFLIDSSLFKHGPSSEIGWYRIKSRRDSWSIIVTEFISGGEIFICFTRGK